MTKCNVNVIILVHRTPHPHGHMSVGLLVEVMGHEVMGHNKVMGWRSTHHGKKKAADSSYEY